MKAALVGLSCGMAVVAAATVWALGVGAATRSVDVADNEFVDSVSTTSTTTIIAGDTVQWTWSGVNPHTVDNNGGSESFSSGAPQTTGTFSHTFNTPGTYNYLCGVHGTAMQGSIVVQAQVATSTSVPQATSTPVPQSTNTPDADATRTSTPIAIVTATPVEAEPIAVSATPGAAGTVAAPGAGGGAAAGGAALPATGTGSGGTGNSASSPVWPLIAAVVVSVAIVAAGWFVRRSAT